MSKQKHYVYKFTFPDGTVYIGSTHDIEVRWQYGGTLYQHQPVGEAIKRFGWENVKKEVLFYSDDGNEVEAEEKRQIEIHKDYCYNCTDNPDWKFQYSSKPTGCRGGYVHVWTINGETKPASDWCRMYGRDQSNTLNRISRYNMTPLEALISPKVPKKHIRSAETYWKKIGFEYGVDKTSYVTPIDEWPEELKIADGLIEQNENEMFLSAALKEMKQRANMTQYQMACSGKRTYGALSRAIASNHATVESLVEFANAAGYDVLLSRRESEEHPIKIVNPKFGEKSKKGNPSPAKENGLPDAEEHS